MAKAVDEVVERASMACSCASGHSGRQRIARRLDRGPPGEPVAEHDLRFQHVDFLRQRLLEAGGSPAQVMLIRCSLLKKSVRGLWRSGAAHPEPLTRPGRGRLRPRRVLTARPMPGTEGFSTRWMFAPDLARTLAVSCIGIRSPQQGVFPGRLRCHARLTARPGGIWLTRRFLACRPIGQQHDARAEGAGVG